MSVLAAGVDLTGPLELTAREGSAHVEEALDARFRRSLWSEIRTGPLRRMSGTFGKAGVRMEIDGYDVHAPFEGFARLAELAAVFEERVRIDGGHVLGLATWRANEAGIGVYRPGSVGITAHLDGRWYRRLVAVFTLVGSARFEVRASRDGEVLGAWVAAAGGVTLMRGPGLAGARDGRPYHAVHGPARGVRCSLALRMNVPSGAPPATAGPA